MPMFVRALAIVNALLVVHVLANERNMTLTIDSGDKPVMVGDPVTLTCSMRNKLKYMNSSSEDKRQFSLIFRQFEAMRSESCQVYNPNPTHYSIDCSKEKQGEFSFKYKSVKWSDRGIWQCLHQSDIDVAELVVYTKQDLEPMQMTHAYSVPNMNHDQEPGSPAQAEPLIRQSVSVTKIIGLGTRTNPFDLREGFGIRLNCTSKCSFPHARFRWSINSGNGTLKDLPELDQAETSPEEDGYEACRQEDVIERVKLTDLNERGRKFWDANRQRRVSTAIEVDCRQGQLMGLHEASCSILGTSARKTVYFLCPVLKELSRSRQMHLEYIRRLSGQQGWILTGGEIVGIAIGSAIAIILLTIGCLLMRGQNEKLHGGVTAMANNTTTTANTNGVHHLLLPPPSQQQQAQDLYMSHQAAMLSRNMNGLNIVPVTTVGSLLPQPPNPIHGQYV